MDHQHSWRYTFIPLFAISSGMSIFIPLYILSLGGTVFDVGIAVALYYLVSIPASLYFGTLTDRAGKAKPFIMLSLIMTFPILLAFLLPETIQTVWLQYAMYAIVATSAVPAINILVIGRKRKKMPRYFSKYGIFSLVGSIIAFIIGLSISKGSLSLYIEFLLMFDILAIALCFFLIRDQPRKVEKERMRIARQTYSLLRSLGHKMVPNIEYSLMEQAHEANTGKKAKSIHQLLVAIVLFNIGYYVFFASYIPFQISFHLSYQDVFVIQIANALSQITVFFFILRMMRKPDLHKYYLGSTILRNVAYLSMIASIVLPVTIFYAANIIAYVIAGCAIALWNLSSTVLLYGKIRGSKEGHYLGVWTGLIACSAILGSFLSGILSNYSYVLTFTISIAFTMASGMVFIIEFERRRSSANKQIQKA